MAQRDLQRLREECEQLRKENQGIITDCEAAIEEIEHLQEKLVEAEARRGYPTDKEDATFNELESLKRDFERLIEEVRSIEVPEP